MMKEDRLALQKAVDSGDTDLGTFPWLDTRMRLLTLVQCIMSCYNYTTDCPWVLSSV
jgi:hypothetical protein